MICRRCVQSWVCNNNRCSRYGFLGLQARSQMRVLADISLVAAPPRRWLFSSRMCLCLGDPAILSSESRGMEDALCCSEVQWARVGATSPDVEHTAGRDDVGSEKAAGLDVGIEKAAGGNGGLDVGIDRTAGWDGSLDVGVEKAISWDDSLDVGIEKATAQDGSLDVGKDMGCVAAGAANAESGVCVDMQLKVLAGKNQEETATKCLADTNCGTVSPKDQTFKSLCKLLEHQGWKDDTEAFLQEHYVKLLTHAFIVNVITHQKTVTHAAQFFHWACKHIGYDNFSCHALLKRLGQGRHFTEMWECLDEMKAKGAHVNSSLLAAIIKSYGVANMPNKAVGAFARAHEYNVALNTLLYTALLGAFFTSWCVREARLLYSRMLAEGLELDMEAWCTLTRGFGKMGYMYDAEICYVSMCKEGYKPSIVVMNGLIEGYCGNKSLGRALKAFSSMQEMGLTPNVQTFNLIISSLCKVGRFAEASNVLNNMRAICTPTNATYNVLLQALLTKDDLSKALEFLEMMEEEDMTDARSYSYLSIAVKQTEKVDEILPKLRKLFTRHCFTQPEICNALLGALCKSSRPAEAEAFFEVLVKSMRNLDCSLYATMISFYCNLEKLDKALQLLSELKARGCVPTTFCYTPLLGAALKADRIFDGMNLFNEMLKLGVQTNAIACDFLLRKLSDRAMVTDALMLCDHILENNFSVNNVTVFSFMKCLSKSGRIKESNKHFRALYNKGCLLNTRPVTQALQVMNKMSPYIDGVA